MPDNTVTNSDDCNDQDATIYPGAPELCDGKDNDCDNLVDEDFPLVTYYFDVDGDGYGSPNNPVQARCFMPDNTVTNSDDCNDQNADVHPGATEICGNGIDDNCNGQTDEGCNLNVRIFINDRAQYEGNSGKNYLKLTVRLSESPTQTVQVNYTTMDITAKAPGDYVAKSGTLTFEPGVRSRVIRIPVKGDTRVEPDETFKVVLSNPVNAVISDDTGVGTIVNDDVNTVNNSRQVGSVAATEVAADKKVTLSPNPASSRVLVQLQGYTGNVTIQLQSVDGKLLAHEKLQVASAKLAQQFLNVSGLANGVYLVRVLDEKGSPQTVKLVIQH